MFDNIVVEVGLLVGFSALVSFLVNLLKIPGWVADGTADKWVAGFNLAGIVALFVVRLIIPDFNPLPIDNVMAEIATVGSFIMGYVLMLFGSKFTYAQTKGLPGIGKTYSG